MSQCHDSYESDPLAVARLPLLVRDVMSSPVVTVEPTATVKEIAKLLLDRDIRAVPVVDIGDVVVGVVSEADVICRECPDARRHTLGGFVDRWLHHDVAWADKAEGITAGEIMTKEVISATPTEPVAAAARRMLSFDVRLLPVLEEGCLVGVLSRHDILRVFDRPDAEVRSRIASLLASPRMAPEGHQATAAVLDGVVHLSGSVRYPSDSETVVALLSEVPGVIEVRSELTAQLPEPKPSYLHDTDWR
jgi:CBS domain-containing protein